jgi:hypothetical protein
VPPPSPDLEAVLFARPASVQLLIAALSASVKVAAFAPPVPNLEIAVMAAAGMVREDWDFAPASTVAMLVVLRTDAVAEPTMAKRIVDDIFIVVNCLIEGRKKIE